MPFSGHFPCIVLCKTPGFHSTFPGFCAFIPIYFLLRGLRILPQREAPIRRTPGPERRPAKGKFPAKCLLRPFLSPSLFWGLPLPAEAADPLRAGASFQPGGRPFVPDLGSADGGPGGIFGDCPSLLYPPPSPFVKERAVI